MPSLLKGVWRTESLSVKFISFVGLRKVSGETHFAYHTAAVCSDGHTRRHSQSLPLPLLPPTAHSDAPTRATKSAALASLLLMYALKAAATRGSENATATAMKRKREKVLR